MTRRQEDSQNWGGKRSGAGRKPTTGPTVKTVAVSLPLDLADRLAVEAEKRGESKSQITAAALTAYLGTT